MAKHRIVGVSFDHMHMGDLLRAVWEHPDAEIVALFDPDISRMRLAMQQFEVPENRLYDDLDRCLAEAGADTAILCSATAMHADYVERIAPHGLNVLVEKPFAANVGDARRMISAMATAGKRLAINWPAAWQPAHNTAKRLVDEGAIGRVIEVHYYSGNRGPLYHLADKVEVSSAEVEAQKPTSWWYKKATGGGSLLDYLGYGATLGTWFLDGEAPLEVSCTIDETEGIEVDQHSITVCRYAHGLSKFETRWGTFTDPWTIQTQPRCGYILVGTDGTLSSYDYDDYVTVQTRARPELTRVAADVLPEGRRGPIEYFLSHLREGTPIRGPLDPELCLIGQRIIDSAALSAAQKRTVRLVA